MSQEPIDYAAVLEDLRIRRDRAERTATEAACAVSDLDDAIAAITRSIVAMTTGARRAESAPTLFDLPPIKSDAFKKMGAAEAAAKYLEMVKRPMSVKDIEKALFAGGYKSRAKRFYPNLYTALKRGERFKQFGKLWGLVDWPNDT